MIAGLRARLSDRNRLPRWVNALVDHIADTPTGLIGRIAARRYGRSSRPRPAPVTTFTENPTRLLIAPVNYSGQGWEWARAIERRDPSITARNMAVEVPGGFAYPADLLVEVPAYHNDREWQEAQLEAASKATHVLIEAEEPPFGRLLGRDVERQAKALLERGVNVAFMAHGTDIRLPSRHVSRTPWSLYLEPSVYVSRLESLARRHRDLLDRMARPVFVSTPDLLADVDRGIWVPVVVDSARWRSARDAHYRGPLRVAHAPSQAVLKGTPLIEKTVRKLEDEGLITYRQISGVASAAMPALFGEADVVLDQFRAGSYGVAACEAMASGAVVVGHVIGEVREIVRRETGRELPIVEATPDTLEHTLRAFARDRDLLEPIRAEGQEFVSEIHDGSLSSRTLIDRWLRLEPTV